jgi:regulator of cell morphogenesis and NO signaling
MNELSEAVAPSEIGALIAHIQKQYYHPPRADLATLVPLIGRVEQVHADDPDAPRCLTRALATLVREMEDHMTREERILSPAMRAGGGLAIERPVVVMRSDHDEHAGNIALIRQLTHDLTPMEHDCGSRRRLHDGTSSLLDDLAAHIPLEHDVRFQRLEREARP